jgi:chitodextrinase
MWTAASTLLLRRVFVFLVVVVALLTSVARVANASSIKPADRGPRSSRTSTNDTQAPSTPTGLTLTSASASGLSLAWSAASDNVGVAGYELSLNGSKVGTTTATSYGFSGLGCGTSYTLAVAAYDAAGNRSPPASVLASTSACADTVAPTTPGPLLQTGAGANSISLAWAPSLDNVGVAGYRVYLNGSPAGTTSFTSYTLGNLACGQSYTLAVDAYDAAGNRSAQASVVAATAPCTLAHASFTPAADSYTSQINPDGTHGSLASLRVAGPNGPIRNSYLRFELSGLSGTVTQATLKLYASAGASSGFDVHAEPDNSWQESSLTWNNAPAFASAVSASSGSVSAGSWLSLDVTPLVQGNGSVSFVLAQNDWNSLYLGSRESANAPVLELTTTSGGGDSEPPSTPSGLSLSGVGTNSLSLAWSASTDNVGVAGYELYLNGSKVGTTTARSYSFGGLGCGTSYTLAVAAYDAAGNHSPKASLTATTAACLSLPTGTVPGTGIMAFGGTLAAYTHLSSYAYVVFGDDYALASPLPGKTLHYTSGSVITDTFSSGVTYAESLANGWLLKDAAGNYMHPYLDLHSWMPDVGDAGYRQRFIDNVLAWLAARPGIDGVEIDNFLPAVAMSWFTTCACWPAKYPDATSWQNAIVGFAQVVGRALKARGYYVMINATGYINRPDYDSGVFDQNWWARLAQTGGVDGIYYENFMQDVNNPARVMDDSAPGSYMHSWSGWQKLVSVAQNNGVDFFGIITGPSLTSDPTTAKHLIRYARGSFLLDWNGGGGMFGYAVSPAYTSGIDSWLPQVDVGAPSGAKYQIGTNIWRRDYANAIVIVNPTLNPFTTTINSATYTIAATDALILAR